MKSYEHSVVHGTNRYEWDGELGEFTAIHVSEATDAQREEVEEVPFHRLVSRSNGALLEALA